MAKGWLVPERRPGKIRVLISAGEVSGDQAGAYLVQSVKMFQDMEFVGAGGPRMKAAGVKILQDTNVLGSVGLSEMLITVPGVIRTFLKLNRQLRDTPPDAAVLIGHDIFHMILGRLLRSKKIPTVVFFPPQVWVWKSFVKYIVGCYDLVLTSFPEEEEIYRNAGSRTIHVGHYLADQIAPVDEDIREKARICLGLEKGEPVIGLFPGSRLQEISVLCPVLLDAARLIRKRIPNAKFVLSVADPAFENLVFRIVSEKEMSDTVMTSDDSLKAMAACDLVLACSGTVTLQAALMNIPMILMYRLSRLSYNVSRYLVQKGVLDSTTIGLPNLITGKKVVEEIHQDRARPEIIARQALALLTDKKKYLATRKELRNVSRLLKKNGIKEKIHKALSTVMREGRGRDFETFSS